MRRLYSLLASLTFAAIVLGCASASPPPATVITVTDVRSLAGRWVGTLIDARNFGTPAEFTINPNGTYNARFGATTSEGTVKLRPDGQLAFTMTSATGLLGSVEASSTAVLYDRGGRRVLVGSGRAGLREGEFSWEATEQR